MITEVVELEVDMVEYKRISYRLWDYMTEKFRLNEPLSGPMYSALEDIVHEETL